VVSFDRTRFKLFTQRILKYLFIGAVPIPLWVSCSTGGSRCGNFDNGSSPHDNLFVGTVLHPSPLRVIRLVLRVITRN
jgi:hypothetical protein